MASSRGQHWNPEQYSRNARFVSDLGAPLVELLEHGCTVVAVDASAEMVQAARALGLDARCLDGQALTFSKEFDAVFTNAALYGCRIPRP